MLGSGHHEQYQVSCESLIQFKDGAFVALTERGWVGALPCYRQLKRKLRWLFNSFIIEASCVQIKHESSDFHAANPRTGGGHVVLLEELPNSIFEDGHARQEWRTG